MAQLSFTDLAANTGPPNPDGERCRVRVIAPGDPRPELLSSRRRISRRAAAARRRSNPRSVPVPGSSVAPIRFNFRDPASITCSLECGGSLTRSISHEDRARSMEDTTHLAIFVFGGRRTFTQHGASSSAWGRSLHGDEARPLATRTTGRLGRRSRSLRPHAPRPAPALRAFARCC